MKIPSLASVSVAALIVVVLSACGRGDRMALPEGAPAMAEAPGGRSPDSTPATEEARPEMAKLRSVLTGEPLTDEEVLFLHQALQRTKLDYTDQGLLTYAEWELRARVRVEADGRWSLFVDGDQVNADWMLFVDPKTGEVEESWQGTVFPIPDPLAPPP